MEIFHTDFGTIAAAPKSVDASGAMDGFFSSREFRPSEEPSRPMELGFAILLQMSKYREFPSIKNVRSCLCCIHHSYSAPSARAISPLDTNLSQPLNVVPIPDAERRLVAGRGTVTARGAGRWRGRRGAAVAVVSGGRRRVVQTRG